MQGYLPSSWLSFIMLGSVFFSHDSHNKAYLVIELCLQVVVKTKGATLTLHDQSWCPRQIVETH